MKMLLNCCETFLIYSAIVSTFMMVCLTTADAGGRYLLSLPIMGAYEITEKYFMVYLIFFSICFAYREGANVRVTFLVDHLPPQLRLAINYLVQIFSILYGISLIVVTIPHTLQVIAVGKTLDVYNIPLGPACMVVPVGLFFMTLRMFLDLWQIKKGGAGFFKQDSATT